MLSEESNLPDFATRKALESLLARRSARRHEGVRQSQRRVHREHRADRRTSRDARYRRRSGAGRRIHRRRCGASRGASRSTRRCARCTRDGWIANESSSSLRAAVTAANDSKHSSTDSRERFDSVNRTPVGSSLKLCILAEGRADLYPRLGPTSEWDIAAAHAVLEAAGGAVMDVRSRATAIQHEGIVAESRVPRGGRRCVRLVERACRRSRLRESVGLPCASSETL